MKWFFLCTNDKISSTTSGCILISGHQSSFKKKKRKMLKTQLTHPRHQSANASTGQTRHADGELRSWWREHAPPPTACTPASASTQSPTAARPWAWPSGRRPTTTGRRRRPCTARGGPRARRTAGCRNGGPGRAPGPCAWRRWPGQSRRSWGRPPAREEGSRAWCPCGLCPGRGGSAGRRWGGKRTGGLRSPASQRRARFWKQREREKKIELLVKTQQGTTDQIKQA